MARLPHSYVRLVLLFFLGLTIAGYSLFQSRHLIWGPQITIDYPQNGSTMTEPFLEVAGSARNIAYLDLNGRQIFIDEHGRFSEKLLLSYGYNIIAVHARDRFSRETNKTLELIYK
jgi:hypothetical protein